MYCDIVTQEAIISTNASCQLFIIITSVNCKVWEFWIIPTSYFYMDVTFFILVIAENQVPGSFRTRAWTLEFDYINTLL
jgi:hypothetical protein